MWLLNSDGSFDCIAGFNADVELAGEAPFEGVPDAGSILITFASTGDGRGFSLARQLRARGFTGTLTATGALIPDQARHAVQSGFDAVLVSDERVERHGEAAWSNALNHSVRELYLADGTSRGSEHGIWALRHSA